MTAPPITTLLARPRYEGANIRTWIGFKHFMYLVEEGVLEWFRERDLGPQRLFHEHGVGLEIVDSSAQLPALLEVDDIVEAQVDAIAPGRFDVRLRIHRAHGSVLGLRGKVTVALVREAAAAPGELPEELAALLREDVTAPGVEPDDRVLGGAGPAETLSAGSAPRLHWPWRARYFHCHFSDRVQHSAYVRALEEVVDRFLEDRGMSIRTLLDERGWIPVVSRARVQLVAAAHMEEIVHTTFTVHEILKDRAFDATMDCHVQRGDRLVHVATARILHGYAASRGENAGALVVLDEPTQARLLDGRPR
jgi:acyl-CoA thioesterase FadM